MTFAHADRADDQRIDALTQIVFELAQFFVASHCLQYPDMQLLSRRREGAFVSGECMDERLAEMLDNKRRTHGIPP